MKRRPTMHEALAVTVGVGLWLMCDMPLRWVERRCPAVLRWLRGHTP